MIRAIYPGSFDPVTNGHLDIIKRSSRLVDELVVAVLDNSAKQPLFTAEERVAMLEESTKNFSNVKITLFHGLLVDFLKEQHASVIIRGLRAITDFEYELQMSHLNHKLDGNVETMFLTANIEHSYLSSTMVKEIAAYDGDITSFVPEPVIPRLTEKMKLRRKNN